MENIDKIVNQTSAGLLNEDKWLSLGQVILKISIILIVSYFLTKILKSAIRKVFEVRMMGPIRISERREMTLSRLLENIITYTMYFLTIIMVLSTLGIEIKGLLAGAGIVGLAVGFGAQNLVKDVISGFFIILEDQFSVGDYIRINTFEGTVEEIGLRTTKIKSATGELHILPNGNIDEVTNFSINNSVANIDISISLKENIEYAEEVINQVLKNKEFAYEEVVSPPQMLGIQNIGTNEVVLRITLETLPMQHFAVARALRKDIKQALDEAGIEIAYPRMVMFTDKNLE